MESWAKKFIVWIDKQVLDLPDDINLLYLEYNTVDAEHVGNLFGYSVPDPAVFDPELQDSIQLLPYWVWESELPEFKVGVDELDADNDLQESIESAMRGSRHLMQLVREKKIALLCGLHESSPRRVDGYLDFEPSHCTDDSRPYYHELRFDATGSHFIEKYEIEGVDEAPLLTHDRVVPRHSNIEIKLWLQKRAKLKDLLHFYRGWLVCSKRLTEIFETHTSSLQIFPATLLRHQSEGELYIPDYFVANLFEKIDCVNSRYLVPSAWPSLPPTFDPAVGFKVSADLVKNKRIFRVNSADYPLLVSQFVRDNIESKNITGITWIKREAVST